MSQLTMPKKYDLCERTKRFALDCRNMISQIAPKIINRSDLDQLVRSSGSVAANYIEADESLSKKDFVMRIKIFRKEAKESMLWLELLKSTSHIDRSADRLGDEAHHLVKIFNSIIKRTV